MDRERCLVVDPDDRLALVVPSRLRLEPPGRRRALVERRPTRDAQFRIDNDAIAERRAEQNGRRADQSARRLEDIDARVALVDDRERQAAVVVRAEHLLGREAGVFGGRHTGEIRCRLAQRDTQQPAGCEQQPASNRHGFTSATRRGGRAPADRAANAARSGWIFARRAAGGFRICPARRQVRRHRRASVAPSGRSRCGTGYAAAKTSWTSRTSGST